MEEDILNHSPNIIIIIFMKNNFKFFISSPDFEYIFDIFFKSCMSINPRIIFFYILEIVLI